MKIYEIDTIKEKSENRHKDYLILYRVTKNKALSRAVRLMTGPIAEYSGLLLTKPFRFSILGFYKMSSLDDMVFILLVNASAMEIE